MVKLYESHEELFKNCNITIIPTKEELKNQDFQKLANIPYHFAEFANVKQFDNFLVFDNFTKFEYFSGGIEWMNRIDKVSVDLYFIDKNFIQQPFFLNLTRLKLGSLVPGDAKYIPRNLKQLTFGIFRVEEIKPYLDLPNSTLESLSIIIWFIFSGEVVDCDLAYLTNLRELTFVGPCRDWGSYYSQYYKSPSNLVTLVVREDLLYPTEDDIAVCPDLTTINCPG